MNTTKWLLVSLAVSGTMACAPGEPDPRVAEALRVFDLVAGEVTGNPNDWNDRTVLVDKHSAVGGDWAVLVIQASRTHVEKGPLRPYVLVVHAEVLDAHMVSRGTLPALSANPIGLSHGPLEISVVPAHGLWENVLGEHDIVWTGWSP